MNKTWIKLEEFFLKNSCIFHDQVRLISIHWKWFLIIRVSFSRVVQTGRQLSKQCFSQFSSFFSSPCSFCVYISFLFCFNWIESLNQCVPSLRVRLLCVFISRFVRPASEAIKNTAWNIDFSFSFSFCRICLKVIIY